MTVENLSPFIALGLTLFTLGMMTLGLKMSVDYRKESKQKAGMNLLSTLKELIVTIQKHRGTSYRFLWGETKLKLTLKDLQDTINKLVCNLNRLNENQHLADRWNAFSDHWNRLSQNYFRLDAENSLEQHNKIITALIYLMEDVAEDYALGTKDLDLSAMEKADKTWKEILTTAEWIGQARALGSGIIASGQYNSVERIRMSFIQSRLEALADKQNQQAARQQLATFISIIQKELLESNQPNISSEAYFDLASSTMDSYMRQFDRELLRIRSIIH